MKKEKKYNIYLVDDDSIYRNTLEYALQDESENKLALKTFATGEECLKEMYTSPPPDIIVLDYHLNNTSKNAMNGIKVLDTIKTINRNIQVIMLSSQEKMEVAINSVRFGAYDYVIKNESAFVRVKNTIENIIYNIDLKKATKMYMFWNVVAGIIFLFLLSMLVVNGMMKHG